MFLNFFAIQLNRDLTFDMSYQKHGRKFDENAST